MSDKVEVEADGPYANITAWSCQNWPYVEAMQKHGVREDGCEHVDRLQPKPTFLVGTPDLVDDIKASALAQGAIFRNSGPLALT